MNDGLVECLNVWSAAVAAGARMDSTYHPGVWRSVKYTCCYAVNRHAAGCKQSTADTDRNSSFSRSPLPSPERRKSKRNIHFFVEFLLHTCY